MTVRSAFHSHLLATFILVVIFLATGCAPGISAATEPPTAVPSPSAVVTSVPQATAVTPAVVPVTGNDVLYQDDFTNPATGWSEAKFDNYFIGYHEPEFYHIEIDSPNYRAPIFMPGKKSFEDATMQVKVQVNSKKTATDGDFAYGIAFRRSGDQYYAFVISPRSQKWMLLKSSPSALTTLAEGSDTSLHAADADDLLRVDAQGSTFSLHINGRLVSQVSDSDYASGEVGFYVQTFDSSQAHVHFDQLTISKFEAPLLCKVTINGLNLRDGPGAGSPFILSLSMDEVLEPLGHSLDGQWLNVRAQSRGQVGWVNNSDRFVSCNRDVSLLPIIIP